MINRYAKTAELIPPPFLLFSRRREFSSSSPFEGCIRRLHIDGAPAKWGSVVYNNASIHGCPEKRDFCLSSPCLNSGTCVEGWRSYRCKCHPGKNEAGTASGGTKNLIPNTTSVNCPKYSIGKLQQHKNRNIPLLLI